MEFLFSIPLGWRILSGICVLGIAAASMRVFESQAARAKRVKRKKENELQGLANAISNYGQNVHKQFPTGDVVVSETDLAEQLRKRPEAVVTALNLLLSEQKAQRAPLSGYWKINH